MLKVPLVTLPVRVQRGALGAREELVPAAVQRALAVGVRRVGPSTVTSSRSGWASSRPAASGSCSAASRAADRALGVGGARRGRRRAARGLAASSAVERRPATRSSSSRALGEHQLDVDAGGDLDPGVVLPGGERVGPRLDLEGPGAGGVRGDPGVVPVGDLGGRLTIRTGVAARAVGVGEHDLGAEPVVALAEHGGGDGEGLADGRLRRLSTEVDDGHDVHDRDASDHCSNLAGSRVDDASRGARTDPRAGHGPGTPDAG